MSSASAYGLPLYCAGSVILLAMSLAQVPTDVPALTTLMQHSEQDTRSTQPPAAHIHIRDDDDDMYPMPPNLFMGLR